MDTTRQVLLLKVCWSSIQKILELISGYLGASFSEMKLFASHSLDEGGKWEEVSGLGTGGVDG